MTPIFVYRVGHGYICLELGDAVDKPPDGAELVASIDAKAWLQWLLNLPEGEQLRMIYELKGGDHEKP